MTDRHRSRRTEAGRRLESSGRAIGLDIRRLREDVGMSQRQLSEQAGIDHGFLARIESGERLPSLATLNAIALAMGGDLSVRIYPGTGPVIRDRVSAAMTSGLIDVLHPRWMRFVEVAVHRPARGVIDLVLHEPGLRLVIGAEVESDLRRLEQEVRWAAQKAESLPSSDLWRFGPDEQPSISRMLLVRSTVRTRE